MTKKQKPKSNVKRYSRLGFNKKNTGKTKTLTTYKTRQQPKPNYRLAAANLRLNLSTLPPVSTNFCLPVKNG